MIVKKIFAQTKALVNKRFTGVEWHKWVINDSIFIYGWTNSETHKKVCSNLFRRQYRCLLSYLSLLLGTTVDALELLLESDVSDMEDKESENSKESESIKI